MNEYEFVYIKLRKDFGRACSFHDSSPQSIATVDSQPVVADMFVEQTILNTVLDNITDLTEHSVNTARPQVKSHCMKHTEGGWPKEVDAAEAQDTMKWRKRIEKDPAFLVTVIRLMKMAVPPLEQNLTINPFEHYFLDEPPDHWPDNVTINKIAVFRDPTEERRSVTKIGWHPEGPTKFVASYSDLHFLRMTEDTPMNSFIWDATNPNEPVAEIRTSSALVCCQYNGRNSDHLVGGCYTGVLSFYDLRKASGPIAKTAPEVSHYDPVYDVVWLQGKAGSECTSVSSDGRLLFWDVRNLSKALDECLLTDGSKDTPMTLGGVSLEWMQEAGPSKFLVGTEHGITLACSKKPKKETEINGWYGDEYRGGCGKHFGPVYACKRNPFHVKCFLTAGDWCAKLWMEDLKGPMLQTPYYSSFVSTVSWSPTRAGVFFLCRHDGYLDVRDYFYRMSDVSLSARIADGPLASMNIQAQGNLVAVGDAKGAVSLLRLCDSLVLPGANEKHAVGAILDHEARREKNLEYKRNALTKKERPFLDSTLNLTVGDDAFAAREKEFFDLVGRDEPNIKLFGERHSGR